MSILLYGLKNCDKCKAAMKHLSSLGHAFDFVDIRADIPEISTLKQWIASENGSKILNTRSTTWRALDDEAKNYQDDDALAALLYANPTLIKRPVVVTNGNVHIGWSEKVPL